MVQYIYIMNLSIFKLSIIFIIALFVIIGVFGSFQAVNAQAVCTGTETDFLGSTASTKPPLTDLNYTTFETCEDAFGTFPDRCLSILGSTIQQLEERYCYTGGRSPVCLGVIAPCPSGTTCQSGACVGASVGGGGGTSLPNPLTSDTFQELLGNFIRLLLIFATPIFILMILSAAFLFITGGQDPNKISTAKNIIKYAIMGYGIILMAQVLVSIVQGIFT